MANNQRLILFVIRGYLGALHLRLSIWFIHISPTLQVSVENNLQYYDNIHTYH